MLELTCLNYEKNLNLSEFLFAENQIICALIKSLNLNIDFD